MSKPQVRRARGGLWNGQRGRDKKAVARAAHQILIDHDLDWLAIAEANEYLHVLRALPGCRLVAWDGGAKGETAILVRDGRALAHQKIRRMTLAGWITVRGGHTPAKYLPSVVVEGLAVGAGHTAPTVDFNRAGKAFGPVRRVSSYLGWSGNAARWLKANHPAALLADFNEPPSSHGHGSPRWIASSTGGTIAAPDQPTHGSDRHGVVMDYGIFRGCQSVTATRLGRYGSDHHAVLFEITY